MQPPREPFDPRFKPIFDEVYLIVWLHENQSLGFKEHRDLLEALVTRFNTIRDHELDDYVTLTEQSENEDKTLDEEPPELA